MDGHTNQPEASGDARNGNTLQQGLTWTEYSIIGVLLCIFGIVWCVTRWFIAALIVCAAEVAVIAGALACGWHINLTVNKKGLTWGIVTLLGASVFVGAVVQACIISVVVFIACSGAPGDPNSLLTEILWIVGLLFFASFAIALLASPIIIPIIIGMRTCNRHIKWKSENRR